MRLTSTTAAMDLHLYQVTYPFSLCFSPLLIDVVNFHRIDARVNVHLRLLAAERDTVASMFLAYRKSTVHARKSYNYNQTVRRHENIITETNGAKTTESINTRPIRRSDLAQTWCVIVSDSSHKLLVGTGRISLISMGGYISSQEYITCMLFH